MLITKCYDVSDVPCSTMTTQASTRISRQHIGQATDTVESVVLTFMTLFLTSRRCGFSSVGAADTQLSTKSKSRTSAFRTLVLVLRRSMYKTRSSVLSVFSFCIGAGLRVCRRESIAASRQEQRVEMCWSQNLHDAYTDWRRHQVDSHCPSPVPAYPAREIVK
ncbi:hypothetical protein ElyMa_006290400 [Elysia marginata]|uniref:Uncharacterized protein n=1 Tax=Elysia marginata TaxID=1093978 RepID=A0AAV4HD85_9GAST|nr:hypothetical protein ElyMa_006290400 [Elysia marginata]